MFARLNPQSSHFGDLCVLSSPSLVMACVPVVACFVRTLRPCPSYSGRRDCINSILLRSLDKGVGGLTPMVDSTTGTWTPPPHTAGVGVQNCTDHPFHGTQRVAAARVHSFTHGTSSPYCWRHSLCMWATGGALARRACAGELELALSLLMALVVVQYKRVWARSCSQAACSQCRVTSRATTLEGVLAAVVCLFP